MPKVISIHEYTLRTDVAGREDELERFVAEVGAPAWKEAADVKVRLLKGVRGDRMGSYTLLLEWPSVELFKRYFPLGPGEPTKFAQEQTAKYAALWEQGATFVASTRFTDYVEVVE